MIDPKLKISNSFSFTRFILLIVTGSLLAACAIAPIQVEPIPATRAIVQAVPPSEAEQLLGLVARIRQRDARDLAAERERARSQFQREKSDLNRIRFALLLAITPGAVTTSPASSAATALAQDESELIHLLDPLLGGPDAASTPGGWEIRALATLLHSMVSERRKIREQLRDAQLRLAVARKDDSRETEVREAREAEARALRARIEELESKIDALKSIDRSVNQRAGSPRN